MINGNKSRLQRGVALQMARFELGRLTQVGHHLSLPRVLKWQILLQRLDAWICSSG